MLAPWLGCGEAPAGPGGSVEAGSIRTRWYQTQRAPLVQAGPAVLGGLAYFGTEDGAIVARDQGTGAERWRTSVAAGEGVRGANLVARMGVLVAPAVGHVTALDAASGRELWRYEPPPDRPQGGAEARSGQVAFHYMDADDATVYVPAWGASVSAVDLRTGRPRWVWEPGPTASDTAVAGRFRSGASGVLVDGDAVFVGVWHSRSNTPVAACEAWVVALDRASGVERWRATFPTSTSGTCVWAPPTVDGGVVLVSARGGEVWALDRATGRVLWRRPSTARYSAFSHVAAGGVVYVDGGDDFLYAVDAATGAQRWRVNMGNGATRQLGVTDRHLYYITDGKLQILDRATGARRAVLRVREEGGVFTGPPAVVDGRVYILASDAAWAFDEL